MKSEIEKMKKNKEKESNKRIQDFEKKQKDLQDIIIKLEKKNKDLENNIKQLSNQKKDIKEGIQRNQNQILNQQELINIKDNFIKDINKFSEQIEQKMNQISHISNIEINPIEFDQLKKDNDLLKQKITDAINELNKVKSNVKVKEQKIENMNKILNEKEMNLRTMNEKYNMIDKKNKILENNNKQLEKQKEKYQEEIKQNKSQITNEININDTLKNEIKNLKQQLNNKNNEELNNKNKINKLIEEKNCLKMENDKQEKEITKMKNQISQLEKREKELNNKNKELNDKINKIIQQSDSNLNLNPPFINGYLKYPLIGLTKMDSNGYINSVLQCLSQTAELTKYFLKESNREKVLGGDNSLNDINEIKLCHAYYELIQSLWKKDASYKSFSPNNFIKTLETIMKKEQNQIITPNGPKDTKDFIIFILETIHNELKKPLEKKISIKYSDSENELNSYDQKSVIKQFFDKFQNETSIISDIFFGFNELTNTCQFCKNNGQKEFISYSYEIFKILIFPLEEVRKNINQLNQGNNPNMITLYDSFSFNQKNEYFTGENKNYCNICRQIFDTVKTSKIFIAPNVLILLLKREKNNKSYIKINFPFQIDISNFVLRKTKSEIYNLYGIITNIGNTEQEEHFIAICKSPVDKNWYSYDDDIVELINKDQKDILNFGSPYILFYENKI